MTKEDVKSLPAFLLELGHDLARFVPADDLYERRVDRLLHPEGKEESEIMQPT